MKAKELRQKTEKELKELLEQLRKKLFQLRMEVVTGKTKKVGDIKNIKRDIARVLTILKEKQNA